MAQAAFYKKERTNGQGEVEYYLEGEVKTRRDKLIFQLVPLVPEGGNINSNEPSHDVLVRASYGDFVDAGKAWTKRDKNNNLYMSIAAHDPNLQMSIWPADENDEQWAEDAPDWVASARHIKAA
ncbi:DUF736 family protein [Kordiimonas sp. SCSIO 12610]|uniref:DUF736 family protein n=1 Tax=Kordiimonas sp. SCSIO 12610 TaxID=2829597 RepID=UPI00210BD9C5|nr:DUF736 family protein [Kordiimonas sp. SCSIO 12610]UTW53953.1 DUF736 family protein [Kordiimonas sp. SCSIO 12610]